MRQVNFEKNGKSFEAKFDEEQILIKEKGMEKWYPSDAFFYERVNSWVFRVRSQEFVEKLTGKKDYMVYIGTPIAEQVHKEFNRLKEEKKTNNIVLGEVKLSYLFNSIHELNTLRFNDICYRDFNQYFTSPELRQISIEKIEQKIENYFRTNYKLVKNSDDFNELKNNNYVKNIVIEVFNGQYWVKKIILKDFQTLENLVYSLFRRDIEKKQEQEKAENERLENLKKQAAEKGTNLIYSEYTVPCNDPREECDLDLIIVYVTPEGNLIEKRTHTW